MLPDHRRHASDVGLEHLLRAQPRGRQPEAIVNFEEGLERHAPPVAQQRRVLSPAGAPRPREAQAAAAAAAPRAAWHAAHRAAQDGEAAAAGHCGAAQRVDELKVLKEGLLVHAADGGERARAEGDGLLAQRQLAPARAPIRTPLEQSEADGARREGVGPGHAGAIEALARVGKAEGGAQDGGVDQCMDDLLVPVRGQQRVRMQHEQHIAVGLDNAFVDGRAAAARGGADAQEPGLVRCAQRRVDRLDRDHRAVGAPGVDDDDLDAVEMGSASCE